MRFFTVIYYRGYFYGIQIRNRFRNIFNRGGGIPHRRKPQAFGSGIHAEESWRKLNEGGTFITRRIIEEEFELLWQEQSKHHKKLSSNYVISGEFAENLLFPSSVLMLPHLR